MLRASGLASYGIALAAGLAVFALFRLSPVQAVATLIDGAVGDRFAIARTLLKATPLLLCGLGMTVAWRAGVYNIGGEGQLIAGALAGALAFEAGGAFAGTFTPWLLLVLGAFGGAVWASLAGWMQSYRGVPAVITTILLNFVMVQTLLWLVSGPLQDPSLGVPLSRRLPHDAMLPRLDRQADLHAGFLIGLLLAPVLWVILYRTFWGLDIRFAGSNPDAARANRRPIRLVQLGAMALSGALCGLAGGVEYAGSLGQVGAGISQNWGFLAIPVALLGGLDPLGVVATALVFGGLFAGSEDLLRFTPAGSALVAAFQAVALLAFVASRQGRVKPVEAEG
ncbi:MAG: ABC transporter permease [Fimbriimonadales bacterium]|nr:ABC transporter permease [Fimbriimonadales bacterium]